jgi:hypothetical protein
VSGCGMGVCSGTVAMVRGIGVSSYGSVVVMGIDDITMLHSLCMIAVIIIIF